MKKLKLFFGIIGLFFIVASCSDDDNTTGSQMRVSAKGSYTMPATKLPVDIVLTSFKINVNELCLKYRNPGDNEGEFGRSGDFEKITTDGPWELDLLNKSVIIATVSVPNGVYKEAELLLSKSLVANSSIYNKTVEIKGRINGTPFIFWHDFDQRLLLNYDDLEETLVVNNNSLQMVFNFDLNELMGMIDISDAQDGDGDGVIEIGPNDTDGNNELAQLLDQNIGGCGGIVHTNDN